MPGLHLLGLHLDNLLAIATKTQSSHRIGFPISALILAALLITLAAL